MMAKIALIEMRNDMSFTPLDDATHNRHSL